MSMLTCLIKLERAILFSCSVFIAAAFCIVVLLRYVFETDLFAYEEWVLTVAFLLYFIGGAAATRENVHIKADILLEIIKSERARAAFQCFVMCLEVIIGLFLTYYAIIMFSNEFVRWPNLPSTAVYNIPLAVPRGFILIGFALMSLYAALHAIRFYRKFRELGQGDDHQASGGISS